MNRLVQRGSTDVSAWVQLLDAAGDYVTGLTYSDVAITARRFLGGRLVSEIGITPAELTAIDDAHADGGFVEDPSRKRYRVDLTDACLATGLDSADKVELKVTASGVVGNTSEELTLVDYLPWNAISSGAQVTTISLGVASMRWWITTDSAGNNVIASGTTQEAGTAQALLINGNTYYMWARKIGYNDLIAYSFVAVAD